MFPRFAPLARAITLAVAVAPSVRAQDVRPVLDPLVVPADDGSFVISGATLARAGARSLGEALLGKIPGLTGQLSSGAFAGLPAVQLRGLSSWLGTSNPLVLVDGLPVSLMLVNGDPLRARNTTEPGWLRLTDMPVADIDRVLIVRGSAAASRYGPRAQSGAIVIETRAPARGLRVAVSERVGVATAGDDLSARRFGLDEAMTSPAFGPAFGPITTAAARAASWQSCRAYCDHAAELFGGTRTQLQSTARLDAGITHTRFGATVQARRSGLPVRGTADDFLGGRAVLQQTFGQRGGLRLAQLIQRTAGNHPLQDGTGPSANSTLGVAAVPTWLNLRGVTATFSDTSLLWSNPLFLAEQVFVPRELAQYVTQGSLDFALLKSARREFSVHGLAGLHRLAQRDGAVLEGISVQPFGNLGTRLVNADLREGSGEGWGTLRQEFGRHQVTLSGGGAWQSWERRATDHTRYDGREVASTTVARYSQGAWWAASDIRLGRERARFRFAARSDRVTSLFVDEPVLNLLATGSVRLWSTPQGYVSLRASAGRAESHLESHAGVTSELAAWRETRHDLEGGATISLQGGRTEISVTAYQQTTPNAVAISHRAARPGVRPTAAGTLQGRGVEGLVRFSMLERPDAWWRFSTLLGHTRARFLESAPFAPIVNGGGAPGTWAFVRPGASPTGVWANRDSVPVQVGDALPALAFSQGMDASRGGWRLTAQLDGELGGTLVNLSQYQQDLARTSRMPDGGAARLDSALAGAPVYAQSASFWALREVVLSHPLGRRGTQARLELSGRNLLVFSPLDVYDPSSRPFGPVTTRGVARNPFPRLRTVSLALVFGL